MARERAQMFAIATDGSSGIGFELANALRYDEGRNARPPHRAWCGRALIFLSSCTKGISMAKESV
jgi:hypothetical protein